LVGDGLLAGDRDGRLRSKPTRFDGDGVRIEAGGVPAVDRADRRGDGDGDARGGGGGGAPISPSSARLATSGMS